MKGIILAGGSGTRLYPLTIATSKQLLPVFDKPLIYYPISVLMLSGIKEILIITTPHDQKCFKKLLGDGTHIGCKFEYATQEHPNGLAEAFIIGESFIGEESVALILGDNIFYGNGLGKLLRSKLTNSGASVFAYHVKDPQRYGVVEFDDNNRVISIEEKPQEPKSSYAVPGLYFYDNQVIEFAKKVKPSARGEKEISSINQMYLEKGLLEVKVLSRGMVWLDTGTFDSLNDATEFVKVTEKRTNQKVACIEEIAYKHKYIDEEEARMAASRYGKSGYGDYILSIIEDGKK